MESQLKFAICDDEPMIAKLVKYYCLKILDEQGISSECDIYQDGKLLLQKISRYNIVLLDIEMPDMDGFSIAQKINRIAAEKYIIFLTCHREWSQAGYKYNAFRYLTKPIEMKELRECMLAAAAKILAKKKHLIKYKGNITSILLESIIYIESLGDNSFVFDAEADNTITPYTLKKWLTILDPISFIQSHKSYIINFNYVKRIEKNEVFFTNEAKVPLSSRNYQKVKNAYISFLKLYS